MKIQGRFGPSHDVRTRVRRRACRSGSTNQRWSFALLARATVKLSTSVLSIGLHSRALAAFASRTSSTHRSRSAST